MHSGWLSGLLALATLHVGGAAQSSPEGAASRPAPHTRCSVGHLAEPDAQKVEQLRKEIDDLRQRLAAIPPKPSSLRGAPEQRKGPLDATGVRVEKPIAPDLAISRLKLEGRARFANVEEFPSLPNRPTPRAASLVAAGQSSERPGLPEHFSPRPENPRIQGFPLPSEDRCKPAPPPRPPEPPAAPRR